MTQITTPQIDRNKIIQDFHATTEIKPKTELAIKIYKYCIEGNLCRGYTLLPNNEKIISISYLDIFTLTINRMLLIINLLTKIKNEAFVKYTQKILKKYITINDKQELINNKQQTPSVEEKENTLIREWNDQFEKSKDIVSLQSTQSTILTFWNNEIVTESFDKEINLLLSKITKKLQQPQ
jgi:hypothetical protein